MIYLTDEYKNTLVSEDEGAEPGENIEEEEVEGEEEVEEELGEEVEGEEEI